MEVCSTRQRKRRSVKTLDAFSDESEVGSIAVLVERAIEGGGVEDGDTEFEGSAEDLDVVFLRGGAGRGVEGAHAHAAEALSAERNHRHAQDSEMKRSEELGGVRSQMQSMVDSLR